MIRFAAWLGCGYVLLLLQSSLLPRLFGPAWRPDLMSLLPVVMGLLEPFFPGIFIVALLGCLQDVFSGAAVGLSGFTAVAVYVLVRLAASQMNLASPLVFPVLAAAGLLLRHLLTLILLLFLSESSTFWTPLLSVVPSQLLATSLLSLVGAPLIFPLLQRRRLHEE